MLDIAPTQSLDVQRPLFIIFDEVDNIETGRNEGLSTGGVRRGKVGARDSNLRHGVEKR